MNVASVPTRAIDCDASCRIGLHGRRNSRCGLPQCSNDPPPCRIGGSFALATKVTRPQAGLLGLDADDRATRMTRLSPFGGIALRSPALQDLSDGARPGGVPQPSPFLGGSTVSTRGGSRLTAASRPRVPDQEGRQPAGSIADYRPSRLGFGLTPPPSPQPAVVTAHKRPAPFQCLGTGRLASVPENGHAAAAGPSGLAGSSRRARPAVIAR
jgi:hypothetical protein